MKICILICGQIRGRKALKHLAKNLSQLNKHHEVSIIISTWSKTGMKFSGALGFGQVARIFDEEVLALIPNSFYGDNFWDNFNILHDPFQSEDVTSGSLRKIFEYCNLENLWVDIEENILDLEFDIKLEDKNSKKMLYKRWRANEIKKRIERNEKRQFDLVLCTRPDLFINFDSEELTALSYGKKTKLTEKLIYLPQNNKVERYVNDIFAYGASKVIDTYTALFSMSISGTWNYIHRAYYDWLQQNSIGSVEAEAIIAKGFEAQNLALKT